MKKHYFLFLIAALFTFSAAKGACGANTVIITVTYDSYPTETSWNLRDGQTGALIDTGNSTMYPGAVAHDTVCVGLTQCLKFTIFDVFGDGICCAYGNGSYTVTLNGGTMASGGVFTHSESTFFNCPQGFDCADPFIAIVGSFTAPVPDTWYVFYPDSTGLYNIYTCGLGTNCDTKIYVYDHCMGLTYDELQTGTTFYNDNGTGCSYPFQSFISAAMGAGDTFYIRIGDMNTSCAGFTINWAIQYAGPVHGCMDTASCNYNPLATIPDSSCLYPPDSSCHAPDLAVDQPMLLGSMYLDWLTVAAGDCYVNEGCLAGYGLRQLLRFTTHVRNIGDQDYYIGPPSAGNQFVWDPCHGHWHYVGYAEYLLFNSNLQQVQVGFKNGFCVLDLECSGGGTGHYGCGDMGISHGCGDIYDAGLDCQWLDMTDIDTGYYTLVVRVNWDRSPDVLGHYEKRYDNNWAQVCIHLYDSAGAKTFGLVANCPSYIDCLGDTFGNAQLDCQNVCNGSAVRGDLNVNLGRDTADMLLYLSGMTSETLPTTTCDDLNSDGQVTVADAARLNGCLRHLAGTLTNFTNAQSAQHLCQFPYNVFNVLDTVTFNIANVNWTQKYFDISILSPLVKTMGYELKISGVLVDSVKNLATGNYQPDIRFSATGHITELSNEDGALFKQLVPLNFLRVYYSTLTDSMICIARVIDAVNENYEQVVGKVGGTCSVNVTTAINDLPADGDLRIIPNPSTGVFDLYLSNQSFYGASIRIFDAVGKMVYENPFNEGLTNKTQFNLATESSGIYFLQVNMKGMTVSKRLVILK